MKRFTCAALIAAGLASPAAAQPDPEDWAAVLAEAKGQTVYWHAWGGDPKINDFIGWVGGLAQNPLRRDAGAGEAGLDRRRGGRGSRRKSRQGRTTAARWT